jgi:hypothetical protein
MGLKIKHNGENIPGQWLWIVMQVVAVLIISFALLSDIIRGRAFYFGFSQVIALAFGILLLALASLGNLRQIDLWSFIKKVVVAIPGWLQRTFRACFSWMENFFQACTIFFEKRISRKSFDAIVLSAFALFVLLYTLGRWNGVTPFIYLGSDASYIASFAHSLDLPGVFANDYFLSNASRVAAYFALHIPLIRFLKSIVGDYGSAFLVLLPPVLFLKLFGFYWLGKKLFSNRWAALLLAIGTFPVVLTGAWDYWGLIKDVLPRNLFEIFLPWLIYFSIDWVDKPKRRWLLFAVLGLLAYVHSISSLILFFAISFASFFAAKSTLKNKLVALVYDTLLYLALILPFALFYFSFYNQAQTVQIGYAEKVSLLLTYFGETQFDTLGIFVNCLKSLVFSGILPLIVFAFLFLFFSRKKVNSFAIKMCLLWITGIITISVVLTYIEKFVDRWVHLLPTTMLLIRGIRYLPPILILLVFLIFFDKGFQNQSPKYAHVQSFFFSLCILAMFLLIIHSNQQDPYLTQELSCLRTGHLTCETAEQKDAVDMINYISQHTDPTQDTFLTVDVYKVDFSMSIRYQAGRAMGYGYADQTRLDDDPVLLSQVATAIAPWQNLEHANPDTKLMSFYNLANSLKANYLVVQLADFPSAALSPFNPVYRNDHYALLKVN